MPCPNSPLLNWSISDYYSMSTITSWKHSSTLSSKTQFLSDDFICDVRLGNAGKPRLISANGTASIMQRGPVQQERPLWSLHHLLCSLTSKQNVFGYIVHWTYTPNSFSHSPNSENTFEQRIHKYQTIHKKCYAALALCICKKHQCNVMLVFYRIL